MSLNRYDLPKRNHIAMKADQTVRRSIPDTAQIDKVPLADGWEVRRFRESAAGTTPHGSILFQGGRGDFFEKYLESFDHWHRVGWNVEAFDWRGQGGSGRLSSGQSLGHISDFSIWVDDLAYYYADWAARTPGPHIVMAHSMGGQIILRALGEKRIAPDGVVLIAPMLGFKNFVPNGLGQRVAHAMTRIMAPDRAGWRYSEKPGQSEEYRSTLLTKSAERYADEQYWWATDPTLRTGPASWQWIEAAYRSMRKVAAPAFLSNIDTPMLILSTNDDKLVDPKAIRHAAQLLKHARHHEYGRESAHEILREADAVRDDALTRIDDFLAQAETGAKG